MDTGSIGYVKPYTVTDGSLPEARFIGFYTTWGLVRWFPVAVLTDNYG